MSFRISVDVCAYDCFEVCWPLLPAMLPHYCCPNLPCDSSDGEWIVIFADGTCSWSGIHPSLAKVIKSQHHGDVQRVRLGPNGTYYAEFENGTVFRVWDELVEEFLSYGNVE